MANPFANAFKEFFSPNSPEERAALMSGLFGTGSAVLDSIARGKAAGAELAARKGETGVGAYTRLGESERDIYRDSLDQAMKGGQGALDALGGPAGMFNARSGMAAKRGIVNMGGIRPPAGSSVNMPDLSGMFDSMRPFVSEEAQLDSERPFWQGMSLMTQGRMGAGDLSKGGYSRDLADPLSTSLGAFQGQALQEALANKKAQEQSIVRQKSAVDQALQTQQQQQQQKKKGGFWSKLGGALKFAAPIAAAFIPGLQPLAAAAIAGGGSVLGSKMQGEGWGSALNQGLMSGVGGYLGAKATGKGAKPTGPTVSPFNYPSSGGIQPANLVGPWQPIPNPWGAYSPAAYGGGR